MDGLSVLRECRTQRLLSESQVDLLKAHVLRNGAVAQEFWTNTKQLHEFRATGILCDEECAAQIQNYITEVLKPASSRKRPAAAVEPATSPASRGSSTQPKAAKSSTKRERALERAAENVLGGNIVNAFAIANRVTLTRNDRVEEIRSVDYGQILPLAKIPCSKCPMTFINQQGLGSHVRSRHPAVVGVTIGE